MKLNEILAAAGIEVSAEQLEQISSQLEIKKSKKVTAKKWAVVEDAEFSAKTPLQMRQCVEAIRDEAEVDMKTWCELLADYEGFKTAQPIERIVAFYKKRMIDEGLIQIVE
jgi:hypothetical protein